MGRALSRTLLTILFFAPLLARVGAHAPATAGSPPVLERFLALDDPIPSQVRALRHLEARNDKFDMHASMDVWTELDAAGFRYRIVAEEGSDYIRSRVFREALEAERALWASDAPDKASFTPANYTFAERGDEAEGLAALLVKPRRKDVLLIDGAIFLRPQDGELLRTEGELAKPPSFWTRHVRVVRQFQRFAGVRMPVSLEAAATVRVFGPSWFRAVYDYETVNAERVGTPQQRAARQ